MTSLLIALLASATPTAPESATLLAMEPLDLLGGNLSVTLEHSAGRSVSLLAGATAGAQAYTFSMGDTRSRQLTYGGGLIVGARWFSGGSAPFGFWMGPLLWARANGGEMTSPLLMAGGQVSSTTARLFGWGVSGQLLAGYTHALGPVVLELGGGLGASWSGTSQTASGLSAQNTSAVQVGPRLYLALGWAL